MKFNVLKGMQSPDYPDLPDLSRFNRGFSAFFRGVRISHLPSEREQYDLQRRINCILIGRTEGANEIALSFVERGLILVDITDEAGNLSTVIEKKVGASNPFFAGSMAAKEWERGYNAGFLANRRQIQSERRKAKSNAASRASGNTGRHQHKSNANVGNKGRKPAA